ncbi:MAG TPA: hypothetical protein VI564_02825 [Candidatus Nanoarchaeia archaeon]|nr:hypothetical protein [Candidatus Nanoarchaeia archaeon]
MKLLKQQIQEIASSISNPLVLIYKSDEELVPEDNDYIFQFLEGNKKEETSLIISGGGGHFEPSIELAAYLRQKFRKHLYTYIPNQASSALAYPILISNHASCCNSTPLSQFDLTFDISGKTYRAKNEITNPDSIIKDTAKHSWGISSDIIRNIISRNDSLFGKKRVLDSDILAIMDVCMRDGEHTKPIRLKKLQKLGFKIDQSNEDMCNKLNEIYKRTMDILNQSNARFVIGDEERVISIN